MSKRNLFISAIFVGGLTALGLLRFHGRERAASDAARTATIENLEAEDAPSNLESIDPTRSREAQDTPAASSPVSHGLSSARTGRLLVHAVDWANRTPLTGARIYASSKDLAKTSDFDGVRVVTGSDGRTEIELPAGIDVVLAAWSEGEAAGQGSLEVPALEPGERREVVIELHLGDDLHYFGRALADATREPIAGATVRRIHGSGDPSWKEVRDSEVTGPDGYFELRLPSRRPPDLQIEAPGFSTVFVDVGLQHRTQETAQTIFLLRSATLRARILDASGSPIPDVMLRLWTESFNLGVSDFDSADVPSVENPSWQGVSDPAGLCVLEGLPPSVPLYVEILSPKDSVEKDLPSLTLNPGEVREIEWRIGAGCRVEGSVVDQDGGVVTGRVWLQRCEYDAPRYFDKDHRGEVVVEVETDAEGRFVFPDVSTGKWWLGPAAQRSEGDIYDAKAIAPLAEVVEIPEGLARMQVDLRVHRGIYILGKVFDTDGAPVPGISVRANSKGVYVRAHTQTREDGFFAMGPLVPGRYSLVAQGWAHADSAPVEADAGEDGVVLRLLVGGSLDGVVVDGTTGEGCPAKIVVGHRQAMGRSFKSTSSQEDGSFRLEGFEPGPHDIVARASGGRIAVLRGVSIQAGVETKDVVLRLAAGGTLSVRYAGSAELMRYWIWSEGTPLGSGAIPPEGSSRTTVPAGRVSVQWWVKRDDIRERELEIEVGEEKEVVFPDGG